MSLAERVSPARSFLANTSFSCHLLGIYSRLSSALHFNKLTPHTYTHTRTLFIAHSHIHTRFLAHIRQQIGPSASTEGRSKGSRNDAGMALHAPGKRVRVKGSQTAARRFESRPPNIRSRSRPSGLPSHAAEPHSAALRMRCFHPAPKAARNSVPSGKALARTRETALYAPVGRAASAVHAPLVEERD